MHACVRPRPRLCPGDEVVSKPSASDMCTNVAWAQPAFPLRGRATFLVGWASIFIAVLPIMTPSVHVAHVVVRCWVPDGH